MNKIVRRFKVIQSLKWTLVATIIFGVYLAFTLYKNVVIEDISSMNSLYLAIVCKSIQVSMYYGVAVFVFTMFLNSTLLYKKHWYIVKELDYATKLYKKGKLDELVYKQFISRKYKNY